MNAAGGRRREGQGSFDATDLVVGLVLAVVIPIVFAVVLSLCGLPLTWSGGDEVVDRTARVEAPPLTPEELLEIHNVATRILDENAAFYLAKWRTESNETAKIFEARWTKRCLKESGAKFDALLKAIENGSYTGLEGLVSNAQTRMSEINGHLDELERENPLGLD